MYKLLFKFGVRQRNPSLNNYLSFLKDSDGWSQKKLRDYQINKCREFLEFAYKNSTFYKRFFDDNNFDPSQFRDIKQLKDLPPITKGTLIKYNKQIQSNYPFKKLFISSTSGTSGESLEFFKDEEWDSHNRAAIFRGYSWYNVKPWDKNAYLWGYNINPKEAFKIKLLDRLQNRFRLFSYTSYEIEKFARELKGAKYLHGYSSMIYEVAKLVNKSGGSNDYSLKMVKGTAEKVYGSYQKEIKKAFGVKIINEYGSTESGIIAFECPKGSMHIVMENVIVEQEEGEILVTNLLSKSFPIIRYKLGDMLELAPSDFRCDCGREHPVILNILGRLGKKIIGDKKEYPGRMIYSAIKNLATNYDLHLNYQAVQHIPGFIEMNIEQNDTSSRLLLEKELDKYFDGDVNFEINYGKPLHKMNGKLTDFVTTIGLIKN
ncbi:phenylacetate--CoA ligase family protein [Flavobacteriaceae bacterium KMM 6897]|nr:phenylacetate--CoA ligase family protein [Flavobacteriaceae bacterium KMM 6897]